MKKGTTKRALLASVLALVLCMTMLIGTTYAWFTDSAASTGNIIKSGILDLEMSWAETPDGTYKNVEDPDAGAIFDYELWEPGYTQIRYVKIANVGNLALKYQMVLAADGTVETTADGKSLADVIDVYYFEAQNAEDLPAFADRSEFPGTTLQKVDGNLSGLLDSSAVNGVLLPAGKTKAGLYTGEVYMVIALHMQEEAGNEYQNLSIGTGFNIKLLATQYTFEEDSFDDQYDAMAGTVDLPVAGLSMLDKTTIGNNGDGNLVRFTNSSVVRTADAALSFSTTQTAADIADKDYKNWIVDFRLTFNKDVEAEKVYLYGDYGSFGWIGDVLSGAAVYNNNDTVDMSDEASITDGKTVAANAPIYVMKEWFNGVLETAGMTGVNFHSTYSEVVNEVGTFNCAVHVDDPAAGLTATLELVVYDPATTNIYVVSTQTFPIGA